MEKLNKRQRDILTLAEEEGYVSVEGLAKPLEVISIISVNKIY